ncbi:MAG: SDR family oxidoreductase [Deltaproteobacteria bacterium]|nr:SDR family oxidoreductase [Deltaproteobacteria bacterium]
MLKDKIAIITGASRGIGKAIALGFAREGAHVVVAARTEKSKDPKLPGTIHDTAAEIEALQRRALALRCDVTDEESVRQMTEKTLETFGRIDILVNNAGVAFHYPAAETSLKRWNLVLGVNITGSFLCSKAVLPAMMGQESGSIINISSLAANERDEGIESTGLAYGVAKAGVERFTWGLAAEVGRHHIRVNCIKPARVIDTEGMRYWVPEEKRVGWGTDEKMVRCALFLASEKPVTGVVATDEELCAWYGL